MQLTRKCVRQYGCTLLGQCYNIQSERANVKTCHVRIKLMFDDDISDDNNKKQNWGA